MRKLVQRLDFTQTDIARAIQELTVAQESGFTHARISVAVYEARQPRVRRRGDTIEGGARPGRIHLHGTEGKVRAFDMPVEDAHA